MRTLMNWMATSLLAFSVVFGGAPAVQASDMPPGVAEDSLGAVTLEGVIDGPSNLVFARLTVDPDQTATMNSLEGSSVYFLLSGSLSVRLTTTHGSGVQIGTEATPGVATQVDGTPAGTSSEKELAAGGSLVVPPGTALEIRNTGSTPAVSLSAIVAEQVGRAEGAGVVWQPLGDPVALAEGAIQIDLTRINLDPGATTDPYLVSGVEVLDVEEGPVVLVLNPGQIRISRAGGGQETLRAGFEDPSASPDPFLEEDEEEGGVGMVSLPPGTPLPGTASGLNSGDGAVVAPGGSRVLRASDETAAVIYAVRVSVTETVAATPEH